MSDVVIFETLECENGKKIGIATLNSEKSLNALSGDMIDALFPQLSLWKEDENIALVLLQGAGEKSFCAGGDIVKLYNEMKSHPGDYAPAIEDYFTKEYKLDYLIHTFNKPFIVWGNGIVMGGGLGMMVGASHRVVTETSRIAMPEISIGLYPDVGGTYFLNKMPESCGLFLGLTGASINASDAKYTGLADFFMLAEKKSVFVEQLKSVNWGNTVALNHDKLNDLMHEHELMSNAQLPVSHVRANKALIEHVTAGDDFADIVNAIVTCEVEDKWFNRAQKSLKHGSAISGHLVYRQLVQGKSLSLAECFRLELGLSVKCGQYGEFFEGVRALLIDKDNNPSWKYSSIAEVDEEVIDWFFTSKWSADEHPLAQLGK
ncbi:enoyl-CoA hydratase/isomerase family protein [Thalassotalea sp. M1531]|uniref:3-hydroxyisobutyryl-CoA hydrolase n=1 Tax=Thalassotalea algicola TaxID=2716224 RepID=A0A7Y0LF86_9GAMM|nr:enoyl-CoA hydratase/isomerase family protein [Thalassotalea algicola]NMP33435.1 enoyl-CoA hydratase/isomerase family protein [Thalassotalea algicola]